MPCMPLKGIGAGILIIKPMGPESSNNFSGPLLNIGKTTGHTEKASYYLYKPFPRCLIEKRRRIRWQL